VNQEVNPDTIVLFYCFSHGFGIVKKFGSISCSTTSSTYFKDFLFLLFSYVKDRFCSKSQIALNYVCDNFMLINELWLRIIKLEIYKK